MSDDEEQIIPRILLPPGTDKTFMTILGNFNNSVFAGSFPGDNKTNLLSGFNPDELEEKGLIFSLGNNSLSNQFVDQLSFDELQNLEQAYFIERLQQFDNVIFVGYSDLEGLQHALHTLEQLFDLNENLYHHYDIIDYPDYQRRGAVIPTVPEEYDPGDFEKAFRALNQFGINTWVYEPGTVEPGSDKLFSSLQDWSGINVKGEMFPYVRKGISLEKLKIPDFPSDFRESEEKELSLYKNQILESADELYSSIQRLNSSNTDLMIFSDRTLWESMNFSSTGAFLLNNQNFNKFMFYRNLFSKALSDYDLDKLPESYLIPFYQGLSRKENLYYDIYSDAIADSMVNQWFTTVLWSGAVKNASLIDPMDLYGIKGTPDISLLDYSLSYQTGSKYFGNFYSLYPGKALTGVLFKPYNTRITGVDPEDFNSEVLLKINDFSEGTRIRLSTAADYFWNTSAYDPAISLWKTLIYYFGKEVAIELVVFNDLYFKLLSISLNMELNGYSQKHEKQASELIIELNSNWDNIQSMLADNISFLNDLSDLKNSIISRYYEAQKNSLKEEIQIE
jgi:hypothetical protein